MTSKKKRLLCIQHNARALTKSRLQEFHHHLHKYNPDLVLLCETHWNANINPRFRAYNCHRVDRPDRQGGGVAILVRKSLKATQLQVPSTNNLEAIALSVQVTKNISLDVFSVYCPYGNVNKEELKALLTRSNNNFILGGDLNAHHSLWESQSNHNRAGNAVVELLATVDEVALVTPKDLGTRVNPSTGSVSTIDLTLVSPGLAMDAAVQTGPHIGSDHLPVHVSLNLLPERSSDHMPKWKFKEELWQNWNQLIQVGLEERCFEQITAPNHAYEAFTETLMTASKSCFRKTKPQVSNREPGRPWYSPECKKQVAIARRTQKEWLKDPLNVQKRMAWNRAEAKKKKMILKEKRNNVSNFVGNLPLKAKPAEAWSYIKCMFGNGNTTSIQATCIVDNNRQISSASDKASAFREVFGAAAGQSSDAVNPFTEEINEVLKSTVTNNRLNGPITMREVVAASSKTRSQAVGPDDVHNEMIKRLNSANKKALTHLFNIMYSNGFVPKEWKLAAVVPLLKQGKPPHLTTSYRPVSLTSNLGKVLERIINKRIANFLDQNGVLQPYQAGFRQGRSTLDHIVQLEHDIRQGFHNREDTTAVFLDLSKAYDSTWLPGLLLKMARCGIGGYCYHWVANLLQNRKFCVRVGSVFSPYHQLHTGVPQGSPLSPTLFNLMLSDFPAPPSRIKTLLYADDIEFHCQSKNQFVTEAILQPYLDAIVTWSRKWKFSFSVDKCAMMVFVNRPAPPPRPLLFLAGHRVLQVTEFKFLGLWFDQRLTWKFHINAVVIKCQRSKNLLLTLTRLSKYIHPTLLIQLFKALVISRIDYGLVVYGTAAKSNLRRIDVTVRQMLRIILGSVNSTPTEHLHGESGIVVVRKRQEWLATKYVIKICHHPSSSTYKSVILPLSTTEPRNKRCTPALHATVVRLNKEEPSLFAIRERVNRLHVPRSETEVIFLPVSKKEALLNPAPCQGLFRSTIALHKKELALEIYTDGSVDHLKSSAACAFWIPNLNVGRSWKLNEHSSIFSAELTAIAKALTYIYHSDHYFEELLCCTDSASAVTAIAGLSSDTHPALANVLNAISCLESIGSKTAFLWVPSHAGIHGNEIADQLATAELKDATRQPVKNLLSEGEIVTKHKKVWSKMVLTEWNKHHAVSLQSKRSLVSPWWFFHKNREVSKTLHRLRTGHSRLKSHSHHYNVNEEYLDEDESPTDPCCRFGCDAVEDSHHVVLVCPKFSSSRMKLLQVLEKNKIEVNLSNLLGLNPAMESKTQRVVHRALCAFIVHSNISSIV
jgi:ribonuclease HI/endonuclease/exonuclease/phosphatase family metal-dependent hydrolase